MHFCIDKNGTIHFGLVTNCQKIAITQAATTSINKCKPSAQFEKELQALEGLLLSDEEEHSLPWLSPNPQS